MNEYQQVMTAITNWFAPILYHLNYVNALGDAKRIPDNNFHDWILNMQEDQPVQKYDNN